MHCMMCLMLIKNLGDSRSDISTPALSITPCPIQPANLGTYLTESHFYSVLATSKLSRYSSKAVHDSAITFKVGICLIRRLDIY